ncbi:MAG: hypothetical protein ABI472_15110 [Ginsengibacter sp.]
MIKPSDDRRFFLITLWYRMPSDKQIPIADKIMEVTNAICEKPSEDFRKQMIFFINELISKDFNSLVQLLYKIDVDEKKLKNLLGQHKNVDAASLIADLIISRQLQKMATRKQFTGREKPGTDDSW